MQDLNMLEILLHIILNLSPRLSIKGQSLSLNDVKSLILQCCSVTSWEKQTSYSILNFHFFKPQVTVHFLFLQVTICVRIVIYLTLGNLKTKFVRNWRKVGTLAISFLLDLLMSFKSQNFKDCFLAVKIISYQSV